MILHISVFFVILQVEVVCIYQRLFHAAFGESRCGYN